MSNPPTKVFTYHAIRSAACSGFEFHKDLNTLTDARLKEEAAFVLLVQDEGLYLKKSPSGGIVPGTLLTWKQWDILRTSQVELIGPYDCKLCLGTGFDGMFKTCAHCTGTGIDGIMLMSKPAPKTELEHYLESLR